MVLVPLELGLVGTCDTRDVLEHVDLEFVWFTLKQGWFIHVDPGLARNKTWKEIWRRARENVMSQSPVLPPLQLCILQGSFNPLSQH